MNSVNQEEQRGQQEASVSISLVASWGDVARSGEGASRVRRCWGAGRSGWIAAVMERRRRGEAADVVERDGVKVVLKEAVKHPVRTKGGGGAAGTP